MIDYKLFQFAAPPRTGLPWFVKAMEMCGLGSELIDQAYIPHTSMNKGLLKVGLVRHPCDWLRSYWAESYPKKIGVSEHASPSPFLSS